MHRNFIPTSINHPHVSHVNQYQLVLPIMRKRLPSYQYHAIELPIINVHHCSCPICDHIRIQPLMYNPHKVMPNSLFITCKPPLIIYTQSHHAIIQ